MYKQLAKLIVPSILIMFAGLLNAHEIHMKDGRITTGKADI